MKILQTFFTLLFLILCGSFSYAQNELTFPIKPMKISERNIGLQETHIYEFSVKTGEYVRFDVEQKNVDPQLVISDADGKQLREMSFERIVGKTTISFIAADTAKFRLKLKPFGASRINGSYRLQMSVPRPSNDADHQRIEAEIALIGKGLMVRNLEKRREKVAPEQWQQRLAVLQQLVSKWQKLNEPNFELETWHQIGLIANKLHNNELAQTAFEKLRLLAQADKENLEEAWALYYLAGLAEKRGEQEASVKYLMTALDLAIQSGAKTIEAAINRRIAAYYQNTAQYEKARGYSQRAADIYSELGDEVGTANARMSLAVISINSDKTLDSNAIFQEALAVFEKNSAFYEKAKVLHYLGAEAAKQKRFELADKHLNESLRLMEKYGEPNDEALVLLRLGYIRLGQRNAEARPYLEKALAKLNDDSDLDTKARVLMALGWIDFNEKKLTESVVNLNKALELAKKIGLQNEQIIINGILIAIKLMRGVDGEDPKASPKRPASNDTSVTGAAVKVAVGVEKLIAQGDYPGAIKLLEDTIKLGEERKQNVLIAISCQRLGGLYVELNDLKSAEKAFQKASDFSAYIDNPTMRYYLVLSVAQLYLRQNRFSEAKNQIKGLKNNNDSLIEASASQLSGEIALKEKDYAAAQAKFTTALNLQSTADIPLIAGPAHQGLGDVFAALGNTTQAKNYYGQSLLDFRQTDSAIDEAASFENLMNSERNTGNRRLAIFYGKQSINLLQTVRRSIKPLDVSIQRNFLSSVESAYRTLAAALLDEGRISEALEVLSLLKEEEFYQFTRRSLDAIPGAFRQLDLNAEESEAAKNYQEITGQIIATKQSLFELKSHQPLTPEQAAEVQKLQTELASLTGTFVELLKALSVKFGQPGTASGTNLSNSQTQAWQKRLRRLGNGTVLLTTLLTGNRYYVIVTTPNTQSARSKEISLPELKDQLEDLRAILEDKRSLPLGDPQAKETDELPLIQELHRILVKPIESDLRQTKARTLLWSLDGILRYVPFATLHDGQNYLVEKYASDVVALAQPLEDVRVSPERWRALGAGVSKPAGEDDPLPKVEDELRAIVRDEAAADQKPGEGIFVGKRLLNEKFTRMNFDLALKQKPQLVHLATHFKLSSVRDTDSFLTFGDGYKLNLAEMRTDKLFDLDGVDLLTFSACETGNSGKDASGVEIESLGVIAQRRGAKAVLASLWRIPDDGTQLLMAEFYQQYKNGKGEISKAEALRQAQLTLLKNRKHSQVYTHPAYWGAFIILENL